MDMSMECYSKFVYTLPTPPAEIIQGVNQNLTLDDVEFDIFRKGPQRCLINWGVTNPKAARNRRIKYPEFERWAKENITDKLLDVGTTYVFVEPNTGPVSTGGHTDMRNFVLLFPIQQGGPNSKLTFWQERGCNVIRTGGIQAEDMSKLKMLGQLILSNQCWTLINAHVIHSVENLFSNRITLQISLGSNLKDII